MQTVCRWLHCVFNQRLTTPTGDILERGSAPNVVCRRQLRAAERDYIPNMLKYKAVWLVADHRHGTDAGDAAGYFAATRNPPAPVVSGPDPVVTGSLALEEFQRTVIRLNFLRSGASERMCLIKANCPGVATALEVFLPP